MNPFDGNDPKKRRERMMKGKLNNFPSSGDQKLKDLILKLLNPDPQKRIGFQNRSELIHHPYFEGCFEETGKIKKGGLVQTAYKVERSFEEFKLKPIPHEFIFRTDDVGSESNFDFDIMGFTQFNQSVSKFSTK